MAVMKAVARNAKRREVKMGDVLVAGELVLYGDVGGSMWDDSGFNARDVINALSTFDPKEQIVVRINSGGGSVWEGVAIYNLLKQRGNVTVYVDGIAASAASVIAMAGNPIIMGGGAMIMIHEPMSDTYGGNAGEHQKNAETLDALAETVAAIYAEHTGISATKVREMMQTETWMGPEDAIANGFATRLDEPTSSEGKQMKKIVAKAKSAPVMETEEDEEDPKNQTAAVAETDEEDPEARMTDDEDEDDPQNAEEDDEEMAMEDDEDEEMAVRTAARKAVASYDYNSYRNAPADIVARGQRGEVGQKKGKPKMKDATLQIFNRCQSAGLSMEQTNGIIAKAGGSVAKAKNMIIDTLADREENNGSRVPGRIVADARDKFIEGAIKGITARAGMAGGERNEFSGMTLKEIAQESLRHQGVKQRFNDPMLMVGAAMQPQRAGVSIAPRMNSAGMASTSDFAEILSNVANKSMMIGYEEAGETFESWTATGSLPDFKTATRLDLGLFPALTEVPEGAEYKYASLSERKVNLVLATYGKMFAITRQSIINDDLSVFSRIPSRMGRAAKRTIGNLVYAVLTGNPTMGDGVALFHANHGNLAGSGGAPTVDTVDAARAAMALQTDADGAASALNLRPSFFLVPVELEGTAKVLMSAQYDPDTANKLQKPNMVAGLATVISDARLSIASSTAWYLAASPSATDTIEVSYLNGVSTPTMEERPGWNVDGLEYKIRIDAGVTPLDHRGFYKNAGA